MRLTALFFACVALTSVAGANPVATPSPTPAVAVRQPPERSPGLMSSREIDAHNAGLTKTHPYFIRCRKGDLIGSNVRSQKVCKTNQDWGADTELSGRAARDSVERTASGSNSGN